MRSVEICTLGVQNDRYAPWWLERGIYGVLRDGQVTLWRKGWTGIPCSVISFSAAGRSGLQLVLACEEYAEMLLDKNANRRVVGGETSPVNDEEFSILYPMLFAHLTNPKWADGSPRQLSTVSVFCDAGVVKCVLKDRELGICLWAACPTLSGLYGVLETLLCDPGAEWRVDRQSPGQKATRVKK